MKTLFGRGATGAITLDQMEKQALKILDSLDANPPLSQILDVPIFTAFFIFQRAEVEMILVSQRYSILPSLNLHTISILWYNFVRSPDDAYWSLPTTQGFIEFRRALQAAEPAAEDARTHALDADAPGQKSTSFVYDAHHCMRSARHYAKAAELYPKDEEYHNMAQWAELDCISRGGLMTIGETLKKYEAAENGLEEIEFPFGDLRNSGMARNLRSRMSHYALMIAERKDGFERYRAVCRLLWHEQNRLSRNAGGTSGRTSRYSESIKLYALSYIRKFSYKK